MVEALVFSQRMGLPFNSPEYVYHRIFAQRLSHSLCELGTMLFFFKTVITASHVEFSALMSPQVTDQVLKIIFPNTDMSKHLPRGSKKAPKTQLAPLAVFLVRPESFTSPDSWMRLLCARPQWTLCHQPQDTFIPLRGQHLVPL